MSSSALERGHDTSLSTSTVRDAEIQYFTVTFAMNRSYEIFYESAFNLKRTRETYFDAELNSAFRCVRLEENVSLCYIYVAAYYEIFEGYSVPLLKFIFSTYTATKTAILVKPL